MAAMGIHKATYDRVVMNQVELEHMTGFYIPDSADFAIKVGKAVLKDEKRPIFVAEDNSGNVQGYAFCVIIQHINDNILTDIKSLYIDDLCVDQNQRESGTGKALYEYVLNYAKSINCYNVTLNVWACNTSAIKFYEKMGLKPQKIGMETIL